MPGRTVMVLMTLCAAACGHGALPADEASMTPAGTYRLQPGQSIELDGGTLRVAFEAVTADSRCPKGETCVWEGSATVRLAVGGPAGPATLELHTSAKAGPDAVGYGGWAIRLLGLEPVPVTGREIAPQAYVASLSIERGMAGTATQ